MYTCNCKAFSFYCSFKQQQFTIIVNRFSLYSSICFLVTEKYLRRVNNKVYNVFNYIYIVIMHFYITFLLILIHFHNYNINIIVHLLSAILEKTLERDMADFLKNEGLRGQEFYDITLVLDGAPILAHKVCV